ncbi:MAG: transposase, partial [Deltaproteobacteria bacterium]|nr:transposase [Deltaproteobacteria bacterium]
FLQYKTWLKEYSKKFGLKIWAYCFMRNHVHFVCVPQSEDSLARTFNTLHMRYSQYFNRKKGAVGHLWQGRFFSCPLDEAHLYSAIRYVEKNPVSAKIVRSPENYKWSSAKGHIHKISDPVLSKDCYLTKRIEDWRGYLMEKEDERLVNDIRKNSLTGRP